MRLGKRNGVGPVIGLRQCPTTHRGLVWIAVALDQGGIAGLLHPGLVKARKPERDGEAHIAPGELFVDDAADARLGEGIHVLVEHQRAEAELVILLQALPEYGAIGDYIGGIR